MKLAFKLILLTESAASNRIGIAVADFKKKQSGSITPKSILPSLFVDLVLLKKSKFKVSDNKLIKALDNDIIRLESLMIKLGIKIPLATLDTLN